LKITKEYHKDFLLSKIRKGEGNPVLDYANQLKKLCSIGFLAVPEQDDINKYDQKRKITWCFDSENVEEIEKINEEIREKLNVEHKKLIKKLEFLKKETSEEKGASANKDLLQKIKNFSFDWDNPKGKVYKTDLGLAIIDWGMCGIDGKVIELSIDTPTEVTPTEVTHTEPPTEAPTEPPTEDTPTEPPENEWLKWVLGLGLLILLLLLKNCAPHAEISLREQSPRSLWEKGSEILKWERSHDRTSIFSRGFLKETPIKKLNSEWTYYMWNEKDTVFTLINKIPAKNIGLYLVQLKITDDGNKLKFWKRNDINNMLITVFMDTTIQHHFTETNEIPFDEDTLPIPEKFLELLYENSDGDEAPNVIDRFPDDPNEWKDTDGDLTGDNSDVFPEDYYEQLDTDGDGHGDFGDPDPNDPNNPTKLVIVSPEGSDAEKNGDGTTGSGSDAEKNGDGTTGSVYHISIVFH